MRLSGKLRVVDYGEIDVCTRFIVVIVCVTAT